MVVMNSPFHLRKADFTYLDRDYYDIDFVKRAYYMLKDKAELIALVRTENTQKSEFKKWLDNHNCIIHSFEYKDWEASKGNSIQKLKKLIYRSYYYTVISIISMIMLKNKTKC